MLRNVSDSSPACLHEFPSAFATRKASRLPHCQRNHPAQIYIIIKYIRFRWSEFIRLSARKYTYRVEEVSGDQNHVQHLLQRLVRHEILAGEYHRVDAWLQVAHIRGEFFLQQHALNAQLITTYQLKRTSIYNT